MRILLGLLLLATASSTASATKAKSVITTQLDCLTANIFFEARGENAAGMKAVAKVTMNRVASKKYPKTLCAVVFQKMQFSWTHQQDWQSIVRVLKGDMSAFKSKDIAAYSQARIIAQMAVKGLVKIPELKESLWYHTTAVNPKWNRKMQQVAKIGNHVFYA